MQRLYFLVPDIENTKRVVDELLLARIPEKQIHVVAKDHQQLQENDIQEPGLLQEGNFIPALERGVAVGGVTGVLAGLAAVTFPPAGLVFGGGAILAMTVAGASFGAIVGPMIGISGPNTQLVKFEDAINNGEFLMLIDVPEENVDKITELVQSHHPNVDIKGAEPKVPIFP